MRRILIICVAVLAVGTPVASAGHESSNVFDLAGAGDGRGTSNYSKGTGLWNSHVRVEGLSPNTRYTFYAENPTGSVQTPICSFTTDEDGDGRCARQQHEEPSFARATIRPGSGTPNQAAPVLQAQGSTDANNRVADGEIERRGDCREPGQAGGTCTAPRR